MWRLNQVQHKSPSLCSSPKLDAEVRVPHRLPLPETRPGPPCKSPPTTPTLTQLTQRKHGRSHAALENTHLPPQSPARNLERPLFLQKEARML